MLHYPAPYSVALGILTQNSLLLPGIPGTEGGMLSSVSCHRGIWCLLLARARGAVVLKATDLPIRPGTGKDFRAPRCSVHLSCLVGAHQMTIKKWIAG